jgi:CDP-diacylglycerol--glycerol-3-phosphate 3-phosphatidyltransferase
MSEERMNSSPVTDSKMDSNRKNANPKGYVLIQSITLARIPLAVLFMIVLTADRDSSFSLVISLILLILIETTDAFDGKIARRFNLVSEYGATLDPYADSISRLIVYASLASQNLVLVLVPLAMAVRDITVAYSRIVLAQKNLSVSARISGKIKAIVQATGSFFALLGPYYWSHIGQWSFYALSWIIITVTLLSSVEYVKDAMQALKQE